MYEIHHYVIPITQSRNISIESANSLMYVTFKFQQRPFSPSATFARILRPAERCEAALISIQKRTIEQIEQKTEKRIIAMSV